MDKEQAKKIVAEEAQAIRDAIESVRAIRGEMFADIVGALFNLH